MKNDLWRVRKAVLYGFVLGVLGSLFVPESDFTGAIPIYAHHWVEYNFFYTTLWIVVSCCVSVFFSLMRNLFVLIRDNP